MDQGLIECPQKPDLGDDILPTDLEAEREDVQQVMSVAYRQILSDRTENYKLWYKARIYVTDHLRDVYARAGATAPPWNLRALWSRVSLPAPSADANAHLRLVEALLTDFTSEFCGHIRYRLQNDGNVHIEFSGPTGMGKSSCAIALANWVCPIEPAELEKHLSFDLTELPRKLAGKKPGQTVIQDEFPQLAGDGARTAQMIFQNIEDTLRASQVNLFMLSPRKQEHNTAQCELELILWNRERRFSVFLVWIEGVPHGVVAIPWMPQELWAEYQKWKAKNVGRAKAGQFRDHEFTARSIMDLCADKRFVAFMAQAVNKPKLKDFRSAIELFPGVMASTSQIEKMASLMYEMCYNYERLAATFEEWFGVKPNAGLEAIARKCYEE
ncbi:MAG: hypothetical protein ACYDBQ_02140 [Thermoplasmatota archaeon]